MSVSAPLPLLSSKGNPVDWWFAFKFNAATYPGVVKDESGHALFGGRPNDYPKGFCLQYACASSDNPTLQFGGDNYLGTTLDDPLGATFNQVYNGKCNYVLWNDQFYGSPIRSESSPWGHSKGMLAWNDNGDGFVLQVSTPSWPASGSVNHPRLNDGNTLGCVSDDDVKVSQHFFCLKVNEEDVKNILYGLYNASIVTHNVPPLINTDAGCPASLRSYVKTMGGESKGTQVFNTTLSSGVALISKPSGLHVPPWQMVSSLMGGIPLRVASWWETPTIPSTTAGEKISAWDSSLKTPPGAVEIATNGKWKGKTIGLAGGDNPDRNHAKIGVSLDGTQPYCIFGDMNQQGTLDGPNFASSQNGRGGLFYAIRNPELHKSVAALLQGDTAPTT